EVNALKVWQDTCHYLYLPRLVNDQVFKNAIAQGVSSQDYFAFASAKEESGRYLGFSFGHNVISTLDGSSLLIDREAALAYLERIRPVPQPALDETSSEPIVIKPTGSTSSVAPVPDPRPVGTSAKTKKQFYGSISLDPVKAKMEFATIIDEVIQQFTSRLGVDVTISVEVQANSPMGFDDNLQRAIKENCKVLKFNTAEFEEE
ncbi:MAG TPA: hypothetical protein PKL69_14905, partial [Agitococcus sp.]|nr:hypothetical protein [Agitococcus sp.]